MTARHRLGILASAGAWAWVWLGLWSAGAIAVGAIPLFGGSAFDMEAHQLARALQGPTLAHPLGFDAFGRDLLGITLRASVVSAAFAGLATFVATALGLAGGTLIALAPGPASYALSRALEALLAFPALLFALAWAAVRGPGWDTLAASLLIGTVPQLMRLMQVRAREILAEDFILAARSLGASPYRVAVHHLAPHLWALLRVKASNLFASALLAEATLSFLGIGAPIGRSSWGSLLAQGKDYLIESPHLAIGTGLPLVLTVLSLQTLAGGRDTSPSPASIGAGSSPPS